MFQFCVFLYITLTVMSDQAITCGFPPFGSGSLLLTAPQAFLSRPSSASSARHPTVRPDNTTLFWSFDPNSLNIHSVSVLFSCYYLYVISTYEFDIDIQFSMDNT